MLDLFLSVFPPGIFSKVFHVIWVAAPIWATIFLLGLWLHLWVTLKRKEWIKKQGAVLLEVRLPKETFKGPAAMELVLNGFFEPIVGTLFDVYLGGRVRDWFSLEIVSIEGQVKFFIWCLPKWKKVVETRLYAQYPNIEVQEVPDYTMGVHYDPEKMSMFAVHTALTKPDMYPIRTYVDYGLNKRGDEEIEKDDPLTPLLEWMGSLGPGEQCWIQIMIQAHRKETMLEDFVFFPKKSYMDEAKVKKEIQKIFKEKSYSELKEGDKPRLLDLSKVEQETIEAIRRSNDKLAYDTMMRCIYFADKEHFNSMGGLGLIGSMRQFGSRNLNGIKPIFQVPMNAYPWQDFRGIRRNRYRKMILDAYKRRSSFNGLYKGWQAKPYVLTTEELATLFHFPGSVAATPTLNRIPSKKAEAPANLPI
jgi:hypothetical protein